MTHHGRSFIVTLTLISMVLCLGLFITPARSKTRASKKLVVFDAAGIKVGEVLHVQFPFAFISFAGTFAEYPIQVPVVPFKVNAIPLSLQVLEERFAGSAIVYFPASDCTGTPFFHADSILNSSLPSVPFPTTSVAPPGNTVYVPELSTVPTLVTVEASFDQRFTLPGPGACNPSGPIQINAVPAMPLMDLDTVFTPPYRVR